MCCIYKNTTFSFFLQVFYYICLKDCEFFHSLPLAVSVERPSSILTVKLRMYLSNIKLWNFRKFGSPEASDYKAKPHLDLNLNKGLNVIIGENDSGKTAIIDAIKLVLKTHAYEYIRADEKDFYKESDRFRIELTFEGFEP